MGNPKCRMWKGLTRIYNYRTWSAYWDSFRITGVWRCVLAELLSPATRKTQMKEKQQLHKMFFCWREYTDKAMSENGDHTRQSCLQGPDKCATYSTCPKPWKTPPMELLSFSFLVYRFSILFSVVVLFACLFSLLYFFPCPSTDALISLISS